jgi:hypothetical protein
MKSSQNELFRWADQIPAASWIDLSNRPSQQAAEAVGAEWDGQRFKVPLLGVQYTIDPVRQRIERANQADHLVSYQAGVILLTTLSISKGVPPSGRMAVPQELPGGRMFFTGAHGIALGKLAEFYAKYSDQLIERSVRLGGEMIEGADTAVRLPGLPYVPLYVLCWRGDQESSARAIIGIDDRAHFHLDLAGIFALTNILVSRLCR